MSNVSQQGQAGGRPPSAVINTNNPLAVGATTQNSAASGPGVTIIPGMPLSPVAQHAAGPYVTPALANPALAAVSSGLTIGVAVVGGSNGEEVTWQYDGTVGLTAAEWAAVTGNPEGLVPMASYYVSDVTPGFLLTSPPLTEYNWAILVGYGISPTEMQLSIQFPQALYLL